MCTCQSTILTKKRLELILKIESYVFSPSRKIHRRFQDFTPPFTGGRGVVALAPPTSLPRQPQFMLRFVFSIFFS